MVCVCVRCCWHCFPWTHIYLQNICICIYTGQCNYNFKWAMLVYYFSLCKHCRFKHIMQEIILFFSLYIFNEFLSTTCLLLINWPYGGGFNERRGSIVKRKIEKHRERIVKMQLAT